MSTVIGVIFDEGRKQVLILQRCDVSVWVLPGGGVDEGEDPAAAVIREVLEETGLEVVVSKKIAEYTPLNKLSKHTHLFECRVIGGALSTGSETKIIGFYPIEELPKSFFIVHRDWLEDALRNEQEVIRKPIWRATYWNLFKYFCQHPFWVLRFLWTKFTKKR